MVAPKSKTFPLVKVVQWSHASRFSVLFLQYIANILVPDHDANVFTYVSPSTLQKSLQDHVVSHLFGGLLCWDAQYFMHLAMHGYTFENTLAFFPLLPFLARLIANTDFQSFFNEESKLILAFVILNFMLFTFTALVLAKLTESIFNDSLITERAVFLFCINPASVFFTAPYTECLFSFLSFSGIYFCYKLQFKASTFKFKYLLLIGLYFSLSILTRSNGLLNLGFLAYFLSLNLVKSHVFFKLNGGKLIWHLLFMFLTVFIVLAVFISLQFLHYYHYCTDGLPFEFYSVLSPEIIEQANENGFVTNNQITDGNWCNFSLFPVPYSYVQDKYWNVGFLRYFQWKQLPNFLLAFPAIYLVLKQSFEFFKQNRQLILKNVKLLKLSIKPSKKYMKFMKTFQSVEQTKCNNLLVFVVHAVFLCIFCTLFVHIQVTTRMLFSANPVMYWFASQANQKFIKVYFLSYFFIGIVMFSNFLPWT